MVIRFNNLVRPVYFLQELLFYIDVDLISACLNNQVYSTAIYTCIIYQLLLQYRAKDVNLVVIL